jgi:serpin B
MIRSAVLTATLLSIAATAAPAPEMELVRGNTEFAVDLYAQLRTQPGNLFLSPHSISTALAMTSAGAAGNTAAQMAATLHLPKEGDVHAAFAGLEAGLRAIQEKGGVKMSTANSLWPDKASTFLPAFLDLCRTHYGADITPQDFRGAPEAARKTINDWVSDRTAGRIQDLLAPGVIDALTRMVLVNAIYFKGDWAARFDPAKTEPATFFAAEGERAIPLMHRRGSIRYAATDTLQLVELPYAGNDLSMLVLLPRERDGLPALEAALTADKLTEWTKALRPRDVKLWLPRFKVEAQFLLKPTLAALGMGDAFDADKADFSGMNGRKDLFIGAVVHKAFVEVNEAGTEAAAATAVVMQTRSAVRPVDEPAEFRADHPFLFFLRDMRTGAILFAGRLATPAGGEAAPKKAGPVELPWEEFKALALKGENIESVFQTHSRDVTLHMKNGTIYHSVEPRLDDIIMLMRGKPGKVAEIPIATE